MKLPYEPFRRCLTLRLIVVFFYSTVIPFALHYARPRLPTYPTLFRCLLLHLMSSTAVFPGSALTASIYQK